MHSREFLPDKDLLNWSPVLQILPEFGAVDRVQAEKHILRADLTFPIADAAHPAMHMKSHPTMKMHLVKKGRCGPGPCGEQPGSQLFLALVLPWGGKEPTDALPEKWSGTGTLGM